MATAGLQEEDLRLCFVRQVDSLSRHVRQLPPVPPGATVIIQNQSGPYDKRWERTDVVVESRPHDEYLVRVHGSGRVTLMNRKFLRQIVSPSAPERQATPIGTRCEDERR